MKKLIQFILLVVVVGLGLVVMRSRHSTTESDPATNAGTVSTVSPSVDEFSPPPEAIPTPPPPALRISRMPTATDADAELLRIARELVAQSPEQAIAWAGAETKDLLRERFLFAILRAWGEKDPNTAVAWALEQDNDYRFRRMEAALTGAAGQPADALAIGKKLLTDDPNTGTAYATALVGALSAAGQFQTAVQLAQAGLVDSRPDWLAVTFHRWVQTQPKEAMQALDSLAEDPAHQRAFRAAVDSWAAGDPAALAAHTTTMSPGADSGYAIGRAIVSWCQQDPAGMAGWLNTLPANATFDAAAALLVTKTDGANRGPEVALLWVQQIGDAKLRHDALLQVVKEWATSDPAAVRRFLSSATWLSAQERLAVSTTFRN